MPVPELAAPFNLWRGAHQRSTHCPSGRLFQRLRKSVLLVTHDMAEAAFFSKNIVLMREGKIVQSGTYRDLIDAPAEQFVSDFVKAQRGLHAEAFDA